MIKHLELAISSLIALRSEAVAERDRTLGVEGCRTRFLDSLDAIKGASDALDVLYETRAQMGKSVTR